jgi:RimJ/RimL family protein N-acetyltransferase
MLEGKKVKLRLFKEDDLEAVIAMNENVLLRGDYLKINPGSLVELKRMYDKDGLWNPDSGMLLVTDKHGATVGEISFSKINPIDDFYDLGYIVYLPERRGQGYMTEAISLLAAYLFELKPIERLQARVESGNTASKRALDKCGFQYEGTLRRALFNRGEWRDLEVYSLLRQECPAHADLEARPETPFVARLARKS